MGHAETDGRFHGADPGERLAGHERRLRLLLAHLAGRAVRARVELDDLVQEAYLRALADPRGLPAHEPGEAPLWRALVLHARHTVIDVARALRAAKRDGVCEPLARSSWSRGGVGAPAAAGPGPATAAAARESGRAIAGAFLELAPEHRRVIGLRQFEGLSAREAGVRMGRSETAVHSLYRRALDAWQAQLERKRVPRGESGPFLRPDLP
jgi:RNA polymerase sigma factor (sigma-70 family)